MTRRTGADGTRPGEHVAPAPVTESTEPELWWPEHRTHRMGAGSATTAIPGGGLTDEWVTWLLDAARTRLGRDSAWVSTFCEGRQLITSATGDLAAMNVRESM